MFSSFLDLLDHQILFYLYINYAICPPGFKFSDFCHLSNVIFKPSSFDLFDICLSVMNPPPFLLLGSASKCCPPLSVELSRKSEAVGDSTCPSVCQRSY